MHNTIKKSIIVSLLFILNCLFIFGQEKSIDILYLKNGGVIKGIVIEHIPFSTIKIQTFDGSIMVYKTNECDSIKKEFIYSNQEAAKIRRNTIPTKFSKNCYYNLILESSTFLGKSKYDRTYYIEGESLIAFSGINIINGIQLHKKSFVGIGTGLNFHLYDAVIEPEFFLSFPVFLDFRYYLLNKKTQPYFNTSAGVVIPLSFISGFDKLYYYFINPSIGVKAKISSRNSINISLGYTFLFNKATLQTYNIGNPPHYDYMDHEVYNNINGFNLKIGFTF
ncbi:MAG TPA: hypothetical protein PLB59_05340 [Bacteroidales bacterium]|nr:hypothetical protein [Bacteroidales bacterium]HQN15538.1 hypothetical protein [Bacteroidales bacterium]HQP15369.1 hypothetical protein [Bacteroidales bacterium]